MEIELNYNELSEINSLIQKKLKYFEMLMENSDSYEEYEFWEGQRNNIAKLARKIFDNYWKAKEELEGK